VVFATLMMLAFLVDQVQQLCCPLFQAAWAKWGSKRLLWEKMRAFFYAYALESMRHLFDLSFVQNKVCDYKSLKVKMIIFS
jgi:hypothetical protein